MGSLPPPELSLDVRPSFVPKTIGDFLREVAAIGDPSRRSSRLEDLVRTLEDEMRKIDAFKRELPLCMLLLQDVIIMLKLELVQCAAPSTQPLLAELMPLKKGSDEIENEGHEDKEKDSKDKKNWKSCLQLWTNSYNNSSDSQSFELKQDLKAETKGHELPKDQVATDPKCKSGNGAGEFMQLRAFSPPPATVFQRREEKVELPVHGLSLLTAGNKPAKEKLVSGDVKTNCGRPVSHNLQANLRGGAQQQNSRKQRRCWSPELHRRFVNALQQLGGSQAATPKQIRELMQVDGLTNDEVKSHLQKYRLHTRRFPPTSASPTNQSQSMVVLGGLWSSQEKSDDASKGNDSSGSPEGPLQLFASAGAASATGGDSMEDEEDTKSESFSWKNHIHRPGKVGV